VSLEAVQTHALARERRGALELLAYDFELRFPPGAGAPFVRFDLNLPAHHNEERELRAHMHLGSDDVISPALMMAPGEMLALFLDGLRRPEDRPKPRAPTAFELGGGARRSPLTPHRDAQVRAPISRIAAAIGVSVMAGSPSSWRLARREPRPAPPIVLRVRGEPIVTPPPCKWRSRARGVAARTTVVANGSSSDRGPDGCRGSRP
jgi:hypothetical protein